MAKLWRVYLIFKYAINILHTYVIVHIEIYDDRKPQGAKAKHGIQDWHLMIFVSILVLVDVIFLVLYTLLEGLVDNFGVILVPNNEKLSSISGVRCTN